MIVPVDMTNISEAARIHSESWKESHRSFCSADFIEAHTPARQEEYLRGKLNGGSRIFILYDGGPAGIVSVTGNLIEDLYVLPDRQRNGYGSELLRFAMEKCGGTPSLWILENNDVARRLYLKAGFRETGRIKGITEALAEIEMALTDPPMDL